MNTAQENFLLSLVKEFPLSPRTLECLSNAKVRYVFELVSKTEGEMLRAKNLGRANLLELKVFLDEFELSFGMKEKVIKFHRENSDAEKSNYELSDLKCFYYFNKNFENPQIIKKFSLSKKDGYFSTFEEAKSELLKLIQSSCDKI